MGSGRSGAGGGGIRRISAFSERLPDTGVAAERRMTSDPPAARQTSLDILTIKEPLHQQFKVLRLENKRFGQTGGTAGEATAEHFDRHVQTSLQRCFG